MMPTRKNNGWIPDIFNDFFDTEWMPKAKATAPAINVIEDEKKYTVEYYVKKAKELEAMGCHIFAIKDMAGLL